MKRIFTYHSYKDFLAATIEALGRGAIAKLAEAAGCNRTYLSQALNSKVQLTPDHVLGISDYLKLNEQEVDYFILLLLYERSASKNARDKIKNKMMKLIQADLMLSQKISAKKDSDQLTIQQQNLYYSNWRFSAIHTLTSIPEYQFIPFIAKKVRLSEQEVSIVLKELQEMGLVQLSNGKWLHSSKNIHIPSGSTITVQNHLNWRLKSVDNVNNKNAIHYTTVFSLSKSDWENIKEQLLKYIDKQRDFIHSSGTDEMYCFCCDLFQPLE